MTVSVDEEGRRPVHTAAHTAPEILAHPCRVYATAKLLSKSDRVQTDRRGILQQMPIGQRMLMLEQRIVHLLEVPLSGRGFGRLCLLYTSDAADE